jgi:hypothetical protein
MNTFSLLSLPHPLTADDTEWQLVLARLPVDLEHTAKRYGAFQRSRGVPSAYALLRLIFAYALGPSLEHVVAWARYAGLATLSSEALDKRLRGAVAWLAYLVGQVLARAVPSLLPGARWRLKVFDASTAQRPGVTQPDRRLHVGLDLATGCLDYLAVTDHRLGEHLAMYPCTAGDLLLVDRGLTSRAGLAAVVAQGADLIGRLPWKGVPLVTAAGLPVDILAQCRTVAPDTTADVPVTTVATRQTPAVPGRLIIYALPAAQAETARAHAQKRARKNGKARGAATWEAAGYLLLFTTVAAALLPAPTVCALYRLRWQIELAFKRLKQLWGFHDIRAHTDALCYTVVLAKVLLALLAEDVVQTQHLLPPPTSVQTHPVNPYRLFQSLAASLTQAIGRLALPLVVWLTTPGEILCHTFADSPRKRKRQLMAASDLFILQPEVTVC